MIVTKGLSLVTLLKLTMHHIVWLLGAAGLIAWLYHTGVIGFVVPWLPVSVIGTAVAFYVGFKNNQSYDRLWEARKIWGGIVNESRTWGMMVDGFVSGVFAEAEPGAGELAGIKRRLIHRHIAWLYAHRSQLLVPTPWEHVSQGGLTAKAARYNQENFGIGMIDDDVTRHELDLFLPADEHDRLLAKANTATQIINEQSRDLEALRERMLLNDFRHVAMVEVLRGFYTLQGQNERIKKFPFPRQYANMSRYFVAIFLLLLPFTMIPEILKAGEFGVWLAAPITALVGWVYVMMEVVADHSENPFQGTANDIPMLSLCRTIEIDLLEMLGETDLPPVITSKRGVLM